MPKKQTPTKTSTGGGMPSKGASKKDYSSMTDAQLRKIFMDRNKPKSEARSALDAYYAKPKRIPGISGAGQARKAKRTYK